MDISRKAVPGRRNCKCKHPDGGSLLGMISEQQGGQDTGAEWKGVENEIRKGGRGQIK